MLKKWLLSGLTLAKDCLYFGAGLLFHLLSVF